MNRLRGWSYTMMWQIQDGGRPPSWISIFGHNFGVDQHFYAKFSRWKIGSPRGSSSQKSDFRKSKMADGRHLGFSTFGHNFDFDQHFCAKFGTVIENQQPKGSQLSKIGFAKIQDGERPPSWISILAHFGVDQHFRTKFGTMMENRHPKGFQFSEIRFSKIQDLSLIHIWRCRRTTLCRSRWSPYH